jgi:hypothetical protein
MTWKFGIIDNFRITPEKKPLYLNQSSPSPYVDIDF